MRYGLGAGYTRRASVRPAPRWCWSAGPTSANPPSSTASPARGGRSSRPWPGRPATPWRRRPSGATGTFTLVDTGGLFGAHDRSPARAGRASTGSRRSTSADLIVFVVDGREGLVPGDRGDRASACMHLGVPVLLAVNKTDDKRVARHGSTEFLSLGFEPVIEVAAEHGDGVFELLDEIVARLPAARAVRRRLPRTRPRSPSSAGRTSESRRWSIGCCAKSA